MITPEKTSFDTLHEALILLVEELIAQKPHEAFGFKWAAQSKCVP
jgi:hypothetical protein